MLLQSVVPEERMRTWSIEVLINSLTGIWAGSGRVATHGSGENIDHKNFEVRACKVGLSCFKATWSWVSVIHIMEGDSTVVLWPLYYAKDAYPQAYHGTR